MTRRKNASGPSGAGRNESYDLADDKAAGQARSGADRRIPGAAYTGSGPRPHRRTDDKIRDDILELLTNNADLDASEVELHVEGGEVTLTGTVESRDARWLTEDLVSSVSGVREVFNRLKVAR
jgi:osmotically-inducible protein OsmY